MLVRDFMNTEFDAVSPDASIDEVAEKLSKSPCGVVPVLTDDRTFLGVVSIENLLNIILPKMTDLIENMNFVLSLTSHEIPELSIEKRLFVAEDLADIDYPTVSPDDSIIKAALLMKRKHNRTLPVVEGGKMIGLATGAKFAKIIYEKILKSEVDNLSKN